MDLKVPALIALISSKKGKFGGSGLNERRGWWARPDSASGREFQESGNTRAVPIAQPLEPLGLE